MRFDNETDEADNTRPGLDDNSCQTADRSSNKITEVTPAQEGLRRNILFDFAYTIRIEPEMLDNAGFARGCYTDHIDIPVINSIRLNIIIVWFRAQIRIHWYHC